jgi:sn-glycerol 3-phosphate transport system substrate-binding protein
MKLRRLMQSAGLVMAAMLLMTSQAAAVVEIQFWHAMGGVLGEQTEKIANDFNATQTEFKVVPVYKGNYTETMTGAIAAFRAGHQPHIVQVFEVGTATMMAAEGAVYPIEDVMTDHGFTLDKAAFLPAVISYYQTPEGKLLSMPFNSSSPVMWYNKDAFAKAGITQVPETWDEVESAARKLVAAGYESGLSFGWQSWVMIENFSAWHNLAMGTRENGFAGLDTRFTFNNAGVKNMVARIAGWGQDKLFQYGGRRGDSLPLFINEKCAMWLNSSAYYGGIKKQAQFEFGQAMLPYDPELIDSPQNSIIGGATLWTLKGRDKQDYKGVAMFMNYLASPEVQAWWHQETGYVPITKAAWELSKKQGFYKENPGTDTAIQQLNLNTPTPNSRGVRFGNFVQIRDIINDELEAVWNGSKTAAAAMDDAVEKSNRLLERFEKANQ